MHDHFVTVAKALNEAEGCQASVYALNTLLIGKGIYTEEEFEELFCERGEVLLARREGK